MHNHVITYYAVLANLQHLALVSGPTWYPVDGCGDPVLITSLQRVHDAQNLGGVATSGGGVVEDSADRLLRVNDEDGADRERNALGVDVGGVLVVKPADETVSNNAVYHLYTRTTYMS